MTQMFRTGDSALSGVDVARDAIQGAILRGDLAAGSRIPMSEVAKQIGTSVTPVREALRELAATGLVDLDTNKGARVHTSTRAELIETYALREMLEAHAMSEVAALPEEERVAACVVASRLADTMTSESDVAEWATLNRKFHATIGSPIQPHWPRLCAMVEALRNVSLLPVAAALRAEPSLMRQANCDHADLVVAVRNGDSASAAEITRQHLNNTRRVLSANLL